MSGASSVGSWISWRSYLIRAEVAEIDEKKMVLDAMNPVQLKHYEICVVCLKYIHDRTCYWRFYVMLSVSTVNVREKQADELADQLHQETFIFKRYFILLDDVWEASVWDDPVAVLVAGILAEMENKVECWEQLANNLGPHIHKDSEVNMVNGSQEGFVKSCEGKSLEDIAEGYLENLIGRNLVMGTKRSSGGKIKACRVQAYCMISARRGQRKRRVSCGKNGIKMPILLPAFLVTCNCSSNAFMVKVIVLEIGCRACHMLSL
ncbi:hypothetical protein HAX54_029363 [Datura stramonium]|uniref:NB-ARC domain-containing protein n=1 Tax=Datura stramonium TaxID=4076 RepID=A0ABS8V5S8_DATST|nr:hypothetical protein [Datura stramonium]